MMPAAMIAAATAYSDSSRPDSSVRKCLIVSFISIELLSLSLTWPKSLTKDQNHIWELQGVRQTTTLQPSFYQLNCRWLYVTSVRYLSYFLPIAAMPTITRTGINNYWQIITLAISLPNYTYVYAILIVRSRTGQSGIFVSWWKCDEAQGILFWFRLCGMSGKRSKADYGLRGQASRGRATKCFTQSRHFLATHRSRSNRVGVLLSSLTARECFFNRSKNEKPRNKSGNTTNYE